MKGAELDARVLREVLAGALPDPRGGYLPPVLRVALWSDKGTLVCRPPGLQWHHCAPGCDWRGSWADVPPPPFSSDMNAAAPWYADALERIAPAAHPFGPRWRLIHATAEQRCRAALEAVAPRPRQRER